MAIRLNPKRLVEAYEIVLGQAHQSGHVLEGGAEGTLASLFPFLSADTQQWCLDQMKIDAIPVPEPKAYDPTVVAAELTDEQLDAVYRIAFRNDDRRRLRKLVHHVPPPPRWLPIVVERMVEPAESIVTTPLAIIDQPLADFIAVDRPQSVHWYLSILARRKRPALRVAQLAPRWIAALHTEDELTRLARLIAPHLNTPRHSRRKR